MAYGATCTRCAKLGAATGTGAQDVREVTADELLGRFRKREKMPRIWLSAAVASAAICLIAPTTAKAEYDVKTALRVYDSATSNDRKIWELIFGNTQNGINWANSVLIRTKQQPLYCPPDDFSLTGPQVVEMLREWASSDPKFGGVPYGFAVLLALQKKFPCTD